LEGVIAIEYPPLRSVAFLLHPVSPNGAKIYEEILEEHITGSA
jgi:hypothetical protein